MGDSQPICAQTGPLIQRTFELYALAITKRDDALVSRRPTSKDPRLAEHVIVNAAALWANASGTPQLFKS